MASEAELLPAQIDRIAVVVDGMAGKLESFLTATLPEIGRSEVSAAYVAQTLENTYTALETLFLRISQHFENSAGRRALARRPARQDDAAHRRRTRARDCR